MQPVIDLVARNAPKRYGDFIQGTKGRPIEDLVIQEESGAYDPLVLLLGLPGHGKTAAARVRMARRNCHRWSEHTYEPCGQCDGCRSAYQGGGGFLDMCHEFDATKQDWRTQLSGYLAASRGVRPHPKANPTLPRVCVIDEFHRAQLADQNSILKVIEDARVSFVLMASRTPSEPAILSRALKLTFAASPMDQMVAWMIRIMTAEQRTLQTKAAEMIAEECKHEPRQSLVVLQALANRAGCIDVDLVRRYFEPAADTASAEAVIHQLV